MVRAESATRLGVLFGSIAPPISRFVGIRWLNRSMESSTTVRPGVPPMDERRRTGRARLISPALWRALIEHGFAYLTLAELEAMGPEGAAQLVASAKQRGAA